MFRLNLSDGGVDWPIGQGIPQLRPEIAKSTVATGPILEGWRRVSGLQTPLRPASPAGVDQSSAAVGGTQIRAIPRVTEAANFSSRRGVVERADSRDGG